MPHRTVRTRDAAGILLIRDNGGPEILLGRRRSSARAFPGQYVFPGGMVEAEDRQPSGFDEALPVPSAGLDRRSLTTLPVFARAALRECYEETGLLLIDRRRQPAGRGRASDQRASDRKVWRAFAERATAPAFNALLPVARAITPCGYPRRFHSRFFMTVLGASAQVRSTDAAGRLAGDGELEDLGWVPIAETRGLPLAAANAAVLHEVLTNLVARHPAGAPWPGALADAPAPCFTWRGPGEQPYRTVIGRRPG